MVIQKKNKETRLLYKATTTKSALIIQTHTFRKHTYNFAEHDAYEKKASTRKKEPVNKREKEQDNTVFILFL